MNNEVVSVQWRGPFSFYGDGDFRSHRECEDAAAKGVYLWTVRGAEDRVDRVWYPGKASDKRGLSARLNDDLRYCLRGKGSDYGCLIDVDKLLHHGISSLIPNPSLTMPEVRAFTGNARSSRGD